MKKVSLITIVLCFCLAQGYAQNVNKKDVYKNEGLFGILKVGLGQPLSVDYEHGRVTDEVGSSKTAIYSLNAIGGYYIVPEFSIGLGLGLDGLHNPTANTFPIYADLRYYVKDEGNSWYGLFDYGRTLKLSDGFKKSEVIRLGIGYKFFTGKMCWVADITYGQHNISIDGVAIRKTQNSYSYKRVIGFSVGLQF